MAFCVWWAVMGVGVAAGQSSAPAQSGPADSGPRGVRVVVDPRVELLSLIFRLAGNPEYNRCRVAAYEREVERYFGMFRTHSVVERAKGLRQSRGVSFDAVMSMAVHLTDAERLGEAVPLDGPDVLLDGRWQIEATRQFLEEARRFVKDADFAGFVREHEGLYQVTASRMSETLGKYAHLEWFDEFFGARPGASFTVALGLLNGGNSYGPRRRTADGREEFFCILGVWLTDKDGRPTFPEGVIPTVIHEFGHSYANPIVQQQAAALRPAGEKLFAQVADRMRRQAYGQWETMMHESLVRACVIRYTRKHNGAAAAWLAVREEKQRGFGWMDGLSSLLAKYESERDRYPTLETFSPRIVTFFEEVAAERSDSRPASRSSTQAAK